MTRPPPGALLSVQALRAVGALLVVAYHAVEQWTSHAAGYSSNYWPNGSAGVDIFFVISGLVMTMSVDRNAARPHSAQSFARDRIIRVVPLYWIVTTLKILVVLALPALALRTTLTPLYVFCSYAMIPVRDATGAIQPVLPVGWTLSYEMFFYSLLAVALYFRVPMSRVCVPVLLVFAALTFVLPSDSFADTIVFEFLFGMAIGRSIPMLQSLPVAIGAVIGPVAFLLLMVVPVGAGVLRPLTWGIPAALIVAAAASTEMHLRSYLPRWLLAAGNASYATYLTHGFVVPAVFIVTRSIELDWAGFAATVILTLVVSAFAGQITHVLIEQPLLLRFRTKRPVSTLPASG